MPSHTQSSHLRLLRPIRVLVVSRDKRFLSVFRFLLDGKHLAELMKMLPLALLQRRRFLGVLAALAQVAKAEAQEIQVRTRGLVCQ